MIKIDDKWTVLDIIPGSVSEGLRKKIATREPDYKDTVCEEHLYSASQLLEDSLYNMAITEEEKKELLELAELQANNDAFYFRFKKI